MIDFITFDLALDIRNLFTSVATIGLFFGAMVWLVGWFIGWFFRLLSEAF